MQLGTWGTGHTHNENGQQFLGYDFKESRNSNRSGNNKVVVTPDTIYLIPSNPGMSFRTGITEACGRR